MFRLGSEETKKMLNWAGSFCWCSGPIHCTHAYASAYATPPRLQGVPTRARLSLFAPTRTPTQENRAPLFPSSSFAIPSQSLSDTDADDVEGADDVEDDCSAKA